MKNNLITFLLMLFCINFVSAQDPVLNCAASGNGDGTVCPTDLTNFSVSLSSTCGLPNTEYIITDPSSVILGTSATPTFDLTTFGITGFGDEFCVTAMCYDITQIQGLVDGIYFDAGPLSFSCCTKIGAVISGLCDDLGNAGINSGNDIQNLQDIIAVVDIFTDGQVTLQSLLDVLGELNGRLGILKGIDCDNGVSSIDYAINGVNENSHTGTPVSCCFTIPDTCTPCPDTNQLTANTQDENGNVKTTFCYGEDIWLDGYIPDENHAYYYLTVDRHFTSGHFTGHGCDLGWGVLFTGQFNEPINLKTFFYNHCGFDFEPNYTYKINFGYGDPCVGFVQKTLWITSERCDNLIATECSLDSYNIKNNCFLDAEVTIENTGISPSNVTLLGVYLSEDPEYDSGEDVFLHLELTPSLNNAQSIDLSFEIEIPHEGLNRCKYHILFIPDVTGGGLYETDNVCSRIVKRCNISDRGPVGGGGGPLGGGLVAPPSDGTGNTVESSTYIVSSVTEADNTIINSRSIVETNIKNYPNPFTKQTTIEFTLKEDVPVSLIVSDLTGKQIAVLLDSEQKLKGTHQAIFDGNNYPAGMYYYTIQVGDYVATQKMTLVK